MPGCQRGSETLSATGLEASPGVWRQAEEVREVRTAAARMRVVERWSDEGMVMVGYGVLDGGESRKLAEPGIGR